MNWLIRFKEKWLDQLADMKPQVDRSGAEAKAFITELYETDAITPMQASPLLNHIGWLDSYIKRRREPVLGRWLHACRWWCVYFGIQLRCTISCWWEDLLDMVKPKPKAKPTVRMTFGEEEVVDE